MLPVGSIDELLGEIEVGNFDLGKLPNFPASEYYNRRLLYSKLESWYSGDALNEKQTQGGRTVDKYPIKLNPIRGAVYKHAYALFGETTDDSRPLAPAILKPLKMEETAKKSAKAAEDFLNLVWAENFGRSLMLRNALLSQIYGGCVFKAAYVPKQDWRQIPIRIQAIHPSNFVGIPMAGDEYRLEEAWIVKVISAAEANRVYGFNFPLDENVYYTEYWNPEEYDITLNGLSIPTGDYDRTGNPIYHQGKNPFGAVPIVYLPHVRASGFYGDSLISDNVIGIVEEYNKRVADYGDAVSDDSHKYYVIKNTSGRPDVYELAPGVRVIQLPNSPNITGKESDPDMDELGDQAASQPMRDLIAQLYDNFRREAFIPGVADGEDEGSQRSALTLAMRMWPLLSHTAMERIIWGDGLNLLDGMLLRIGVRQKLGIELKESDLAKMRIERRWAPVLPRDREAFINELVNRATVNLGSLRHLLSLIDDIDDPDEQIEEIKSTLKEMAKAEAAGMPKPAPPSGPQSQPGQQQPQQKKPAPKKE